MSTDLDRLQGTWNVVSLESDGQKMPATAFSGARIVVNGREFKSLGMGATYEGTLEVDAASTPKAFDLLFTAGHAEGHRNLGIYQLDGDIWTICLATRGNKRPKKFETKAGTGFALETLERNSVAGKSATRRSKPGKASVVSSKSAALEQEAIVLGPPTELEGEWAMTAAVFDGVPMDKAMVKWCKRITRGNVTRVVAGPQVFLNVSFTLDLSVKPARIDYVNLEGPSKAKTQAGIFELSGDELKICMSAPNQERPTVFSSRPGDNRSYTTWRRTGK